MCHALREAWEVLSCGELGLLHCCPDFVQILRGFSIELSHHRKLSTEECTSLGTIREKNNDSTRSGIIFKLHTLQDMWRGK